MKFKDLNFNLFISKEKKIAVVGLGYVGLPLAVNLAKYYNVIGYDLKKQRIDELKSGHDSTMEISDDELKNSNLCFTYNEADLSSCNLIIVAVPTPIDEYRIPDLTPLKIASSIVGKQMTKGVCVVFESTVYPGVTEEVCVPIMENKSKLKYKQDFTCGYSPERINPGDKVHSIDKVVKIVSGSDSETLEFLSNIYGQIVKAGIHKVSSIKVAEAAKVIENTQRDLNIALMNELAMIFDKLGIDTNEVLEAAGTKWNFLPFKPGLVGGHCIGVDPYYLTFKAESLGYHPEMILAGRRINDNMGKYIAEKTVKLILKTGKSVKDSKVAILGLTFKEDVPDLRNTRVIDIIDELKDYGISVIVNDPYADHNEAYQYYGIKLHEIENIKNVNAVIISVKHKQYINLGISGIIKLFNSNQPVLIDVKSIFNHETAKKNNIKYWRL